MISSASAHSGLFHSFLDLVIHARPVSLLGGRSQTSAPSPEELTAHLDPHMLVDIGLLDPRTAGLGAGSPTSQPLIPPVSAMHRRGDWSGQGPQGGIFAWPLRV